MNLFENFFASLCELSSTGIQQSRLQELENCSTAVVCFLNLFNTIEHIQAMIRNFLHGKTLFLELFKLFLFL